MPFEVRSFDDVLEFLVAAASGRFPNSNTARHGDFNKRLRVVALGLADTSYNLRQAQLDVMPDTASGNFIDRHGAIWGVTRKAAVGGSGGTAYRVFGDVGATVPVNEPLTHLPSGLGFETTSGGVIPAAGFLDVDLAATSTGVKTNLEADQELNFDSTPVNLEQAGRILKDLTGGKDRESDADYQARILDRIGAPELGGARSDYEKWLLEAADYVATGYVYPNRDGKGRADLVGLKAGRGTTRLLDAGERTTVFNYIDPLRPVTAIIRILETLAEPTDVEVRVRPESSTAYVFDWDDSSPPTVLAYTPATRTLQFAAARPTSMAIGDRLTIDDSPNSDGAEFTIEALSGADSVVITEDLGYTPTVASPVYSGGPLVSAVRANILDLIDNLGPSNPDTSGYGPWEGNLRVPVLFEVVQTTPGVLDSDVIDPAATVEATDSLFPANETVGLITPQQILVRRWH